MSTLFRIMSVGKFVWFGITLTLSVQFLEGREIGIFPNKKVMACKVGILNNRRMPIQPDDSAPCSLQNLRTIKIDPSICSPSEGPQLLSQTLISSGWTARTAQWWPYLRKTWVSACSATRITRKEGKFTSNPAKPALIR